MKRKIAALIAALALMACLSAPARAGKSYDVVIIGAGGGGLSAGSHLAQNGFDVLVIEQHYKPGGYMTSFERGDYIFEVSLHALDGLVTEYGMNKFLHGELGIRDRVEYVPLDPCYRAHYPGMTIDVPADPYEYRDLLIREFPDEERGIRRLFRVMDNMSRAILALNHLNRGERNRAGIIMLKRPRALWPMVRYKNASLAEMMDDFIKDERLRNVFSWLCLYLGLPPEEVPAANFIGMWTSYHYGGYSYVRGTSQKVSDALAEVIEENGGKIMYNTRAVKIEMEEGRAVAVVADGGERFPCRYVVSNASAPATLENMVGREHLPESYLAKLDKNVIGPTIFQVYLGVGHDYTEAFGKAHSMSVAPDWKLIDEKDPDDPDLPRKLGYALVNYSVVDPGAAPPGKNVIGITTYMPYDWMDGWKEEKSHGEYARLKDDTARIFIERAEEYLPGLSDHVEVMEVGSPRTMEHFTLNPKGAVYGYRRGVDSMKYAIGGETPIPNLFLAGAWANGGGQNPALWSGYEAAKTIVAAEGK